MRWPSHPGVTVHMMPGVERKKRVDQKTTPRAQALFDLLFEDFHEIDQLAMSSSENERKKISMLLHLHSDEQQIVID